MGVWGLASRVGLARRGAGWSACWGRCLVIAFAALCLIHLPHVHQEYLSSAKSSSSVTQPASRDGWLPVSQTYKSVVWGSVKFKPLSPLPDGMLSTWVMLYIKKRRAPSTFPLSGNSCPLVEVSNSRFIHEN